MSNPKDFNLISILDGAVTRLLEQVDPTIRKVYEGEPPVSEGSEAEPIGFSERLKAIELGVKWVATKNKLDAGDSDDEFSRLRQGHIRGAGGGRRSGPSASRPNGGGA